MIDCLATLGPGVTNLLTGLADANMDRAPVIAIIGQGSTKRLHKESHQNLHATYKAWLKNRKQLVRNI